MTRCLNAAGDVEDVALEHDRGFLVGDGVFETLRVQEGAVCWLADHHRRLGVHAGAVGLTVPWSLEQVGSWLRPQLPQTGKHRLRLTLTAGEGGRGYLRPEPCRPRLFASISPASNSDPVANMTLAPFRVPVVWPAKTLSGLDRVLHAPPAGSNWVMVNELGFVTESTMANVFWVRGGRLETPSVNDSMLGGLTRERCLADAGEIGLEVVEDDFTPEVLGEADAMFVTGTVAGLVDVLAFEGRRLAGHEIVGQLRERHETAVSAEIGRFLA